MIGECMAAAFTLTFPSGRNTRCARTCAERECSAPGRRRPRTCRGGRRQRRPPGPRPPEVGRGCRKACRPAWRRGRARRRVRAGHRIRARRPGWRRPGRGNRCPRCLPGHSGIGHAGGNGVAASDETECTNEHCCDQPGGVQGGFLFCLGGARPQTVAGGVPAVGAHAAWPGMQPCLPAGESVPPAATAPGQRYAGRTGKSLDKSGGLAGIFRRTGPTVQPCRAPPIGPS